MVRQIILMILVPVAIAVLTAIVGCMAVNLFPRRIDERYISLLIGIPWSIGAGAVAARCWSNGFRRVAMFGLFLWWAAALMAAVITIAFWHG